MLNGRMEKTKISEVEREKGRMNQRLGGGWKKRETDAHIKHAVKSL